NPKRQRGLLNYRISSLALRVSVSLSYGRPAARSQVRDEAVQDLYRLLDLLQDDPFVRGVGLGNVSRTEYDRRNACRCDCRGVGANSHATRPATAGDIINDRPTLLHQALAPVR